MPIDDILPKTPEIKKQNIAYSDYCKRSIQEIIITVVVMVVILIALSLVQATTPATFCILIGLVRIVAIIPTPQRYGEFVRTQTDLTTNKKNEQI